MKRRNPARKQAERELDARRYYRALKSAWWLEHEAAHLDGPGSERHQDAIALCQWAYRGLISAARKAGWKEAAAFEGKHWVAGTRDLLRALQPCVAPKRRERT
jgi:hypothetical protein